MNTLTLNPIQKQLFQINPQHSHPRLSLRRVLWAKFLRWVDKASPRALCNLGFALFAVLVIAVLVFAPLESFKLLAAVVEWNGYRVPLFLGAVLLAFRGKRCWRLLARRTRIKARAENQHTYEGLPVDELATKLLEWGSFKRDEAMKGLLISQEKHQKIAAALEDCSVLVRGDNHARVLNEISREQLVQQLAALAAGTKPPLVFDADRKEWIERDGNWERHLRDQEKQKQKDRQEAERMERRKERAEKGLEKAKEELTAFQQIMAGTFA